MQLVGTRLAILGSLFALAAAACSSGPVIHELHLRGESDLNRNTRTKQSTPVNVRIYQIKDRAEFSAADFDSLWRREKERLGDSLVTASQAVVVTSGFDGPVKVAQPANIPPEDVKYLGVVGLFNKNDPTGDGWRICVPVEEIDAVKLSFQGYRIVSDPRQ